MTAVRLGYEVGSAEAIDVDLKHLGVTGLTQESGKTTTLEALAQRGSATVLIFRTKRGDIGFSDARRVGPYFRERTDWQFVEGLISAHLHEKARIYRGDLIRMVRGAKSLKDVHANIQKALQRAREGSWPEKIYTELDQYLREIIPALELLKFAPKPELAPRAARVMDLEGMGPATQQLVIAATVDWVMEHETDTVLILPEARDFIPEGERTPAKRALEDLIRKGASLRNYLWLDSQALTGVDMDVARSIGTWLFGRQTLDLECRRVARMAPGRKIKADDISALKLGQFFVVRGEDVRKVYVQPAWMNADSAASVARGTARAEQIDTEARRKRIVDEKERREFEERIRVLESGNRNLAARNEHLETIRRASEERITVLEATVKNLQLTGTELTRSVRTEHERAEANSRTAGANAIERIRSAPTPRQLARELEATPGDSPAGPELPGTDATRERIDLHVERLVPNLAVHEKIVHRTATSEDNNGRIALLIAGDFLTERKSVNEVCKEFRERGWGEWKGGSGWNNMDRLLLKFAADGFLRNVDKGYVLVPEAKQRIRVDRVNDGA